MEITFKTYCIITPDIGKLGGAQLYSLRRLKYLQQNNCRVSVITGSTTDFVLQDDFEGIEILVVPEIFCNPNLFMKKRVANANERIFKFLQSKDTQVIESHSLAAAVYAEIVAKKIDCKHIVYLLNEDKVKSKYGIGYTGFFDFKLNRGELFGVSSMSLEIILSRKIDLNQNKYINIPYDTKELLNQENNAINHYLPPPNTDFKIFTIARLDKAYVKDLINDTIKVSQNYVEYTFFLLIIGDSSNKERLKKLKKLALNSQNLTIVFAGYIHPVPETVYKNFDLFIGNGTASVSSISQGCATAVIDPRDNKSPGFLGINTNNFGYPENDIDNRSIENLLNSVVNDTSILVTASQQGLKLFREKYDNITVMKFFDMEIKNSSHAKDYWNFYFTDHLRNNIEFCFIFIFGIKVYMSVLNKMAYLLNK